MGITRYLPLKTGGFGYFMMFIQFFYLYQLSAENDVGGVSFSMGSIALIILSMVSVWWLFQIVATVFSQSRRSVLISVFVTFVCYDLLIAYQFGSQELVEWSFILSNIGIAFSMEALDVSLNSLDTDALLYIPVIALIFLPFEIWRRSVSNLRQTGSLVKKALVGWGIYFMLVLSPIDSYDPMVAFFRSVIHHHFSSVQFDQTLPSGTYLSSKMSDEFITGIVPDNEHRPAIFLIVCESLNEGYLNQRTEDGLEITPFLNQLMNNSVYVDTFYGNSIQTAKAHFATYFSMIPVLNGKAFVKQKKLHINSIASVLSNIGYRSIYFNAHDNHTFDNVSDFLTKRGYSYESLDKFLQPNDSQFSMRWGVEDQIYFKRFFDYYDQELSTQDTPIFVTLPTIAHHFPFNSVPKDRRFMYADPPGIPKGIRQHYANSIHLTDMGLSVFFDELKKRPSLNGSLVIIIGDHAFPLGQHGNYNLESGYHEESFRIPMYIVWDGYLEPMRISRASSQLDVAPTILDLLSVRGVSTTFQGQSVFSDEPASIPLIQPYGKHLSVVEYPLKYRYNTRLKKEYVYHLQDDPMETTNIIDALETNRIDAFRDRMRDIYRVNYAIVNNQVHFRD